MRIKSNWLGWSCCLLLLVVGVLHAAEPRQSQATSPRLLLPEPAVAPAAPAGLPQERLQNNHATHDAITGTDSASS